MNMPSQNTTKEGMESSHGRGRRLARTRCQVTCACRAGGVPQVHPFQVNGFYLNSESWTPKIAKALVRTFKLVLKGFDVIPIVAPDDGRLRRLQHTFKVGLETTQVPLSHHDCSVGRPAWSNRISTVKCRVLVQDALATRSTYCLKPFLSRMR